MTEEKIHKERHGSWWALSPLLVFLCLYLVTSILVNDFYKVPITVAFLVSSCYAIAITRGLKLDQRIYQFSVGVFWKRVLYCISEKLYSKGMCRRIYQVFKDVSEKSVIENINI